MYRLGVLTSFRLIANPSKRTSSTALSNPSLATGSKLHTHPLQVGRDEGRDVIQVFQIAALAAGHVGDMAAPRGPPSLYGGFFEPDLDDERMRVILQQAQLAILRTLRC